MSGTQSSCDSPGSPIVLSFETPTELLCFQRSLVMHSPAIFRPSIQGLNSVDAKVAIGASSTWCHLDCTDVTTVQSYFQYYGKMANQMNMLQDSVRTELYRMAIFSNLADFKGKRVLDVGAGSGILSFFSSQAGVDVV